LIFDVNERGLCSCVKSSCCRGWNLDDHGIANAFKLFSRKGKKKDKMTKKASQHVRTKDVSMQTEESFKMEVDEEEGDNDREQDEVQVDTVALETYGDSVEKSSKSDSCCSNKSEEGYIRCDMSVDSGNSLNTSDITPSDQRSNNENGSSLKESDADAMSKKSDSSSSDKQLMSSESESELKSKVCDDFFKSLFTDLSICFPQWHSDMVPWLVEVDFDDNLKMNYHIEKQDPEIVLQRDKTHLEAYEEPELVRSQLRALMEDVGSNVDLTTVILGDDQSPMVTEGD